MTPTMPITDLTAEGIENRSIFGSFRNTPFPSLCSYCFCSVCCDFISFLSSFLLFFMISSSSFRNIALRCGSLPVLFHVLGVFHDL